LLIFYFLVKPFNFCERMGKKRKRRTPLW